MFLWIFAIGLHYGCSHFQAKQLPIYNSTINYSSLSQCANTQLSKGAIILRNQLSKVTYNKTNPFSVRVVGIFVADSELPYTLELAKPSINIAIKKVSINLIDLIIFNIHK